MAEEPTVDQRIRFYFDKGLTQPEIELCLSAIDGFQFWLQYNQISKTCKCVVELLF